MNPTQSLKHQAFLWKLIHQLREHKSWCGETHVQKAAYFVDRLTNHTVDASFVLYKHGPYSFQLSDELGSMQTMGFTQIEVPDPRYGPRLQAGPAGQILLQHFGDIAVQSATAIDFVVSKLADCGVVKLEKLATALYFTDQEGLSTQQRAQKIHAAKPHVSEEQALEAVKDVDNILAEWRSHFSKG